MYRRNTIFCLEVENGILMKKGRRKKGTFHCRIEDTKEYIQQQQQKKKC